MKKESLTTQAALMLSDLIKDLALKIDHKDLSLVSISKFMDLEYHSLRRILKDEKLPTQEELAKILKYLGKSNQLASYLTAFYPEFARELYQSFAVSPEHYQYLPKDLEIYLTHPRYHQLLTFLGFSSGATQAEISQEFGTDAMAICHELIQLKIIFQKDNRYFSSLEHYQSSTQTCLERIKLSTEYYKPDNKGLDKNAIIYLPLKLNRNGQKEAHKLLRECYAKLCQLNMNEELEANSADQTTFFVSFLMDDFKSNK